MVKLDDSIAITLEWKKNKTWGFCPIASGIRRKDNGTYYDTTRHSMKRSITGCGYDKHGTAIAEVLNNLLSQEEISKTNSYGVNNGVIDGACGTYDSIMTSLGYECLSSATNNSESITYYK
jgi:hypothetical protein